VHELQVGLLDAVDRVLQRRLQRRQRRSQLVRHVGHELAAHAVGLLELGTHRVERLGEAPHLVAAVDGHALAVLAARHRRRGARHLAQRRGQAARDDLHDGEREDDRHDGAEAQRQAQAGADEQRGQRHADRGDDDDPQLELDRADAVQWPHGVGRSCSA
jgi:hypothetical protein